MCLLWRVDLWRDLLECIQSRGVLCPMSYVNTQQIAFVVEKALCCYSYSYYWMVVLRIESRASHILGRSFTTELHIQRALPR